MLEGSGLEGCRAQEDLANQLTSSIPREVSDR